MRVSISVVCAVGLLAISVAAWAAPHKVRVHDPAVTRSLIAGGGRLIADYGSFQVVETEAAPLAPVGGQTQDADESDVVELNVRRLNTRAPEVVALRKSAGLFAGRRLHLVHFAGPIKPEWKAALEQGGARVLGYVPQNAYLIYADAASLASVQSWSANGNIVQWEGEYADDYKIHPRARLTDTNGLPRQLETDTFAIQLVDDAESNAQTLALINQLKLSAGTRQFHSLGYFNVIVRLPPDRVTEVASRPEVVSIQPYIEPRRRDERQDQIVAGNLFGNSPAGPGYLAWLTAQDFSQADFTASGFAVDVTDSGIDNGTTSPGHFGLYQSGDPLQPSRVIYNRVEGTPNGGSSLQGCDGHGNLNSHIIAGYNDLAPGFPHTDSAGFHYGLGVCPFVKVGSSVIFDPDSYTYPSFTDLQSRAYHDGARISANSWGANVNGAYNADSQAYDALVRDAQPSGSAFAATGNQQMVIVFAAGNAGAGATTINSPGSGKNVITVGAAENVNSHATANGGNNAAGNDGCNIADASANSAGDIATFSSRGPCTDGRMKPDLVAPGTHITGGVAQDSPPALTGTGSAIACFAASGVCALPGGGTTGNGNNFFPLGQQFYTTSSGTSHSTPAVAGACALLRQYFINNGLTPPSPAMTKAFLMNSTRYLDGVSANDTLWSANQGMGELNLGAAFDKSPRMMRDQSSSDKFTASGQTRVFTGTVADPSKPFRITLAWTDAPGSTSGNAYNNDLDLTLTIGDVTYKGNVFSGPFSIAGGAADAKNNVESILLPAGISNSFAVTITAANINSDGVPNEAPTLDQDFALVIYNATEVPLPVIEPGGFGLAMESCSPTNGAIDPGETVTVNLDLRNTGTAATTNLVVTLLATNSVISPDGPQTFGILAAGGSTVSRPFTFTANGTCGGTLSAVFDLQDGPVHLGSVSQSITLGATTPQSSSRTNATSINLPATGTSGPASLYPSTVSVSDFSGTVTKVTISLRGLSHTYPDDLDVLLVGPTGQKVLLMSDAGGGNDINSITLTFDDNASASLPNSSQLTSGTCKPSNNDSSTDGFASPAPGSPYSSTLSVLNGQNPNGTWSLFIRDDSNTDTGILAQGWSLTLVASNVVCCDTPVSLADLAISEIVAPSPLNIGSNLALSITVTNRGPDSANSVTVMDTLSPGLDFVSATVSQGECSHTGGLVTWALGGLSNGASAAIVINVTAASAGVFTNYSFVTSATGDAVPANNSAVATVSVNSFPVISDLADLVADEDAATPPIEFIIQDAESEATALILSKSSSNPDLVPEASIVFGGSGSNRSLTISPAPNASGSATITVSVSDGLSSAGDSFLLTVNPVNDPPVLAAIPEVVITESELFTLTNSATDIEAPPQNLSFGLDVNSLAAGAEINATTGVLTWTPGEAQGPGTNVIVVIVTDDGTPNLSATQSLIVVVLETNRAPVLSAIPDQTIIEGEALVITNGASDGDLPANALTFGLDPNSAPVGAEINATNGVLTWTPGEAQGPATNVVSVIVTDDGIPSLSATQSFTVVVLETNGAPVLAPQADRILARGDSLALTNAASDPDLPANALTFTLDTNSAPVGAEINAASGMLTWTPGGDSVPSTNHFSVMVSDDGVPSLSATQSFTVVVRESNSAPVLGPIPDYTIFEGETLVFTNLAGDSDVPVNLLSFSLDTNSAPAGAEVNVTSGVFTWTPGEAQGPETNVITVIVTDDGVPNLNAAQSFMVVVLETNRAPVLGPIPDYTIFEGETLVFTNQAGDTDIPVNLLSFSLDTNSAPAGAEINATNGVFTWTPSEAHGPGTNVISVMVTDDGVPNLNATQSFTVVVVETNSAPVLSALSDQAIVEGETLVITNLTSDGDFPVNKLSFTLDPNTAPAGAEINATNGVLTWTPGEADGPGTNVIAVIVTDDGVPNLSTTQNLTVVVLETNGAPALGAISDYTIHEGETLVFTNQAGDTDIPVNLLSFSLDTNNAPVGAEIDVTNGVFTWTPGEAQGPGTNVISVIVADDGMPSMGATQTFTVVVLESNSGPVLAIVSDQILVRGDTLALTNLASDPDLPANMLTFTLDTNNAPLGAEINATNGLFTWTPDGAQVPSTNVISVLVTDDGLPSLSATRSFTVVVLETNSAPVLGAIPDYTIFEGETLVFTNQVDDIDVPVNHLTFSLDTNTAPAGAEINATNGEFTWTPSEAQGPATNVVSVIVTDDGIPSLSATQNFTVVVLETNSAPLLGAISDHTVFEGVTLVITNVASDSDLPANTLAFRLDTNTAPVGAAINVTNGVFTWTPNEAQGPGTNVIMVIVTDDGIPGLSSTQSFTVVVLETNSAPILAGIADRAVHAGSLVVVSNSASDPDLPVNTLVFSLDSGGPPAGMMDTNGVFTWATSDADVTTTNSFTVRVTDDGVPGLTDARTFTVAVVSRPLIERITVSNDIVAVAWNALAGLAYRLQYQSNLAETNWINLLPDVTAGGTSATNTHPAGLEPQRFYRLMLLP